MILAKYIYLFYTKKFPGRVILMELIRSISWISSAMDKPIYYDTPLLVTIQDYMKDEILNLWAL